MNTHPFPAPPSTTAALSQEVRDTLKGWRKLGTHVGSLLGPEHDIRIIATGKIYRIGDLTYLRLKNGAEPTPYGWLELDEDGNPAEEDI